MKFERDIISLRTLAPAFDLEKVKRERANLLRRAARAAANGNLKQFERCGRKCQEFDLRMALLKRVLDGIFHGHDLARFVDGKQKELGQPRSIAFRKSYASEAWTEKYS